MRQGQVENSTWSRLALKGATETAGLCLALGEETLSAADSSEVLQGLVHHLQCVGGHDARAEHGLTNRDGGVEYGVGVEAFLKQRFPEDHSRVLVSHVNRDYWSLGPADINSHIAQPIAPARAEGPQAFDHSGFALQDIQCGERGCGEAGGRLALKIIVRPKCLIH